VNLGGARVLWIGGFQAGGPEPAGGWQWVTGEKWGWTNWSPGEPNDADPQQQYLECLAGGAGRWNDNRTYDKARPFIVEFEPDSSEGGLVYLVETDDGSCIVGEPQLKALKARWAPVGELEVPLAKVQSIEFNARRRTAEVVSQSGDVLQVALSLARFDLDTLFGAVSIPLEHVARLTVGPAGGFDGRKGAARIFRTARNLLVNGDFESGPDIRMACFPLNPGSTAITGWTVTRGQIDYQDGMWQSSDRRVVDLDGSPGFGGIAQTFQTVPGQSYRVTFDMAGDLGGAPQIKRMRVEAAGQSAEFTFDIKRMPVQAAGQSAEFTFDAAGRSRENMGWVTRTWQFTATERQTTIEFFSLDAVGRLAGPVIDNTMGGWLRYLKAVGGLAGPVIDNVLLLPSDVKAGAVGAPQFGSVIGVDDGSCIVGNPTVETLTVASGSVGRIEVPINEIVSITRGEGREPATVTLRNGDVLNGTLDAADLELETSYGTLSIPIEHVVRFSGAARETAAPMPAEIKAEPVESPGAKQGTLSLGLVAYYPFEGDAKDASGNNNQGTPEGKVEYVQGVVGKAVRFYGIDDRGYIHVPNSESLKFGDAASIALWVRNEDDAGQTNMDCSGQKIRNATQVVVAKSCDRIGFVIGYDHFLAEARQLGLMAYVLTPRQAGAHRELDRPLRIWTHVAVVFGMGGTRLYHNGKLVTTDERPVHLDEVNQEDMYIGIQAGKGSCLAWWYPLNGMVDELRIYNRALSPEEIEALYSAVTPPPADEEVQVAPSLLPGLNRLRDMRVGQNASYDQIHQLAEELALQYPAPADLAQICLAVLEVHLASGGTDPDKGIEYAKRAESLPMSPVEQCQLYCTWAYLLQGKGGVVRREIARIDLKGVKVALDYKPTEVPPVGPVPAGLDFRGAQRWEEAARGKRLVRLMAQQRSLKDLRSQRGSLEIALSSLYAKEPFDTAELRELATEILQDKEEVEYLVALTEEKIKAQFGEDALQRSRKAAEGAAQ